MAEPYVPGLQMQNWESMPSLTQSILSGNFAKSPLGIISAALLGSTYGKEKQPPAGAVVPEMNQQNWQNIPSTQMGAPVPPPGLSPEMINKNPMGLGPTSMRMPQTMPPIIMDDINRIKQTLWD